MKAIQTVCYSIEIELVSMLQYGEVHEAYTVSML